jgi:hypothetical protein
MELKILWRFRPKSIWLESLRSVGGSYARSGSFFEIRPEFEQFKSKIILHFVNFVATKIV